MTIKLRRDQIDFFIDEDEALSRRKYIDIRGEGINISIPLKYADIVRDESEMKLFIFSKASVEIDYSPHEDKSQNRYNHRTGKLMSDYQLLTGGLINYENKSKY
ncbi:hypothetical protein [Phaeodactylibacter xiamenensis]|uniref:hypothetical protein n=1 Tax=Phaeodactylibacter xiamenensis TaxID=1524460 RepID=UPI0024AA029A|nr:hypothetical protein [Phaeodactylibacter xiamenensis]